MAKATADKACRMDIRLTQPQRKNYEKGGWAPRAIRFGAVSK